MMSAPSENKIKGRLERRDRDVRKAILFVSDDACLAKVDGSTRLVRLLRQLRQHGIKHVYLAGKVHLVDGVWEGKSGLPSVTPVVTNAPDAAAQLLAALDRLANTHSDSPLLLVNADVAMADSRILHDMLSDPRPNVMAVELRLARNLDGDAMKVQMEAVDVPWFTRRVVGLSKDLRPEYCHGVPAGIHVIGPDSFRPLLDALRGANAAQGARYENVLAQLMSNGHEFYTVAVEPGVMRPAA
jgi:choline kinase